MTIPDYELRSFSEIAASTTLNGAITDSDTSIVLAASTGWPTGSSGDFYIRIENETIRVDTRTANTLTVLAGGRGANGTTAAAHASGSTVTLVYSSFDAAEANRAVNKTIGKATAVGQILVADATGSFAAVQGKTSGQVLMGNGTTVASTALSGDATVDGSGVVTLANGAATFAKQADIATDRLVGRDTAGTGDPEALTVGGGLEFTGSGGIQRSALTGDVTAPAGSGTTSISGLALSKLATQADQTILGNTSGGAAVPTAMTPAQTMAMLSGDAAASFSMNSQKITSLATPTSSLDAATKAYVDKNRTYTQTTLPGAGNWNSGDTISTITITDPGYNIKVWVAGSVIATANTLAFWELQCFIDGVKCGGIVIPQASSSVNQTYAILGVPTSHTSGTNCTILIKAVVFSGTGTVFNTAANTGANNLMTAFYTWDGT